MNGHKAKEFKAYAYRKFYAGKSTAQIATMRPLKSVARKMRRLYEQFGRSREWMLAEVGQ